MPYSILNTEGQHPSHRKCLWKVSTLVAVDGDEIIFLTLYKKANACVQICGRLLLDTRIQIRLRQLYVCLTWNFPSVSNNFITFLFVCKPWLPMQLLIKVLKCKFNESKFCIDDARTRKFVSQTLNFNLMIPFLWMVSKCQSSKYYANAKKSMAFNISNQF